MRAEAKHEESKVAEQAMSWYGWGSPVGLGLFLLSLAVLLVAVGILLVLVRFAILGH